MPEEANQIENSEHTPSKPPIISFFQKQRFGSLIVLLILVVGLTTLVLQIQKTQLFFSNADVQGRYTIYFDSLASGWKEWSNADVDPAESNPVYSGNRSISYIAQTKQARLYFHTSKPVDTGLYTTLHFAARATKTGQRYYVALLDKNEKQLNAPVPLANYGGDPVVGKWTVYDIPLSALHADNTQITGFTLQGNGQTTQPKVFIDEIDLRGNASNTSPTPTTQPKATPTSIPNATPTTRPTNVPTPTKIPGVTNAPTPTPISTGGGVWWKPTADNPIQLHWQLSTDFNPATDFVPGATVYDFDGEHASNADVQAVHDKGLIAICYIDVGVYEDYRSDASRFPKSVIGKADAGWAGSWWLDIRQLSIIQPIMYDRIQMCKQKGFDAVEPDEENGYDNASGFPLTYNDQLVYNRWIADTVHSMGMSVGLKSAQAMAADMVNWSDWNLSEECYQYNECNDLAPFKAANKATFIVEYAANPNCSNAIGNKFNAMKRDLDLVGPHDKGYLFQPCTPVGQKTW